MESVKTKIEQTAESVLLVDYLEYFRLYSIA